MDFDHVAIATDDVERALNVMVGELGGTVVHGGDGYGFRWVQARLGTATTGMTIEILRVWQPEVNDFLARFVHRHGVGVHHLTFKVADLPERLEHAHALGLHPVGVNLDDPQWREAFLQPKEAHGTVVQLAQTDGGSGTAAEMVARAERIGADGSPIWWAEPPARALEPVTLRRVVLGSPDRGAAVRFFEGFLDGAVVAEDAHTTDLRWPGDGVVRLTDARTAGVVRLEADGPRPSTVDLSGATVVVDAASTS